MAVLTLLTVVFYVVAVGTLEFKTKNAKPFFMFGLVYVCWCYWRLTPTFVYFNPDVVEGASL